MEAWGRDRAAESTRNIHIAAMTPADADAVLAIYQAGLDTGQASFETTAPSWADWDVAHLPDHRLVAMSQDGRPVGWAALSPVSRRRVYAGVAEVSIYVATGARGMGVGRALLRRLIVSSEAGGMWTLQAGIFPENHASVRLHTAQGFRIVGRREKIGWHLGRWRDTLLLERRTAGTARPPDVS